MTRTVLIVDDDREVQRYLAGLFEAQGFRVICEKDGDWALKTFEQRPIDAVLLDILIPVMSGLEVAEAIRNHPRGKAVAMVMLTGIYRGTAHRAEAIRRFGLLDYLDKPIEGARVVKLVKDHFARREAEEAAAPRQPTAPPERISSEPPMRELTDAPPVELLSQSPSDPEQSRERREVERATKQLGTHGGGTGEFRGTLKRVAFPRLLHRLYRLRASGALFLLRGDVKKIVYFKDGHPTYIKSNQLSESLGAVLVKERLISDKERSESVKRMIAEKRRHGAILIEMGVISPHNLKYGLEVQLEAKLYDVFGWTEGEYQFKEGGKLPEESVSLEQSNASIILEGVRRTYDAERLEQALAGVLGHYAAKALSPELAYQEVGLSDAERLFLSRLDGRRTVAEVIGRLPDRQQGLSLVYALLCAGMLEARGEPAAGGPPPLPAELLDRDTERPSREAITASVLAARGRDHFALFGIERGATSAEIERAYAQLARAHHPDRFRDQSDDVRTMAAELFERYREAHATLLDGDARARYLATLPAVNEAADDPAARSMAADRLFKLGEAALRRRDHEEAESAFRRATELQPGVAEYHAYLGWTLFCAGGRGASHEQAALGELGRAVELSPRLDRAHLLLGYLHRERGRRAEAERRFEEALRANPDCQEAVIALKELREA